MPNEDDKQVTPPKTQQEALQVLVRAIEIAQSRGAFNLFEAAEIVVALELFKTSPDED